MTKLTTLIASALIALSLTTTAQAADKLILGNDGAYAPFHSKDKDGNLIGFDIEIGNALCKVMEVECEWVTTDWDSLIPALDAKKIDAILSSMSITSERKKKIDFTQKYYSTPIQCVREVGKEADPSDPEKVKGKKVGVQSGVVADNFARAKFKDLAEVIAYKTQEEADLDLLAGRLDLVCADSVVLVPFIKEEKNVGKIELIGGDFTDVAFVGEGVGIGVRKGETELAEKFNQAIQKIRDDGTYAEINKKYFDFDLYGN
ncbi:transporter substrate-binding domain-containing protein [Thiofilum flexile]|uniref:transporter substrate-binding domain-containing protein n=1 Tax=Thiofilum flexile TaxID=125627 RepID=UPI000364A0A2|nr:transporter substrate-binding domain-containing protein [Thiofilum flexile]